MLDVLFYLFENYISNHVIAEVDPEELTTALVDAGFDHQEIIKAFHWLDGLVDRTQAVSNQQQHSLRVFTLEEQEKLEKIGQSFIIYLENSKILTPHVRELVIDRIMALDKRKLSFAQLKLITLMVLYHQQEAKTEEHFKFELMLMDCGNKTLH